MLTMFGARSVHSSTSVVPDLAGYSLMVKSYHLLEEFELLEGEPLAHCGYVISGSLRRYSRGVTCSLDTFLGTSSIEEGSEPISFLSAIMMRSKCKRFPASTEGAITSLAHANKGDVLFVFNP